MEQAHLRQAKPIPDSGFRYGEYEGSYRRIALDALNYQEMRVGDQFRNCIGQHLAMSGVCRSFQLAGQVAAREQALTLAIAFALFGESAGRAGLVRSNIASVACSTDIPLHLVAT